MPKRAIFVVHGVGSQPKGDFLDSVLDPLVTLLRHHFGHDQVRLRVELRPASGPAWATIDFLDEHWEIAEAHWADSFFSAVSFRVLGWLFWVLVRQFGSILAGLLPFFRRNPYPPSSDPVYGKRPTPLLSRVYDWSIGSVLLPFLPVAYLTALMLATLFFAIAQLPRWLLFPRTFGQWAIATAEGLVKGMGDEAAMLIRHTSIEAMKKRLLDLLEPYLHSQATDPRPVDNVTVIAHSGGATVALAALADPAVWRAWPARPRARRPTGGLLCPVTFITVGSSLQVAYRSAPKHPMFQHPLPADIGWVDFWARYDPVPHGPPSRALHRSVRGTQGRFEAVRVVNQDNPFSDHDGYWRNFEEVVNRFVYEIAGCPQSPPQAAPHPIRALVDEQLALIRGHRFRVGFGSLLRIYLPLGLLVGLGLIPGLYPRLGGLILRLLPPDKGGWPWPLGELLIWLGAWSAVPLAAFLVGLGAVAILLVALWHVFRLWVLDRTLYKLP